MTSLVEAFDVKVKQVVNNNTDYDLFKDKKLLDHLRIKIIESLTNIEIPTDVNYDDFVNSCIDSEIEGYDLNNDERSYLFNLINDELTGYGPLTNVMNDNNITTIMVNSPKDIYIESNGEKILDKSISFIDNDHIIRTIEKLVSHSKSVVDLKEPIIEANLDNGTKINAILPPISKNGPILTISKYNNDLTEIEELIRLGSLTNNMALYLENAAKSKINILICGKSGSGRTSLLNVLSNFIPQNERILSIEEGLEIKINNPNVIALDISNVSNPNDIINNSLKMRPNRIVLGELNSKIAFNFLQIITTGYEGTMTTIHAANPEEALSMLETMIIMGGFDYDSKIIKEYICRTINLIINIEKTSDGKRRITKVILVKGIKNNSFVLEKVFEFVEKGITKNNEIDGEFISYLNLNDNIEKESENKEYKIETDLPKLK